MQSTATASIDVPGGEVLANDIALRAGTNIGHYVVGPRLGAGGMGVVYLARDTRLGRDVALKIVASRRDVYVTEGRLQREAMAMAQLSHPNVVRVYELGSHDDRLFIAMEVVDGATLRSWIAAPRPWRDVVRLFIKAGRGLAAAHAAGLVHRDFKPDNVLIGRSDEPRITDFGLARRVDGASDSAPLSFDGVQWHVTATGRAAGTLLYMAPELLRGEPAGAPADQFSFCVSLFEVLHGTRPFPPVSVGNDASIAAIRERAIVSAPTRRVPRWLHKVIARGLAFEAVQRWPSMPALVDALERGMRAHSRRRRILVAVLVLTAAVALRGGGSPGCFEVARKRNEALTVLVCQEEYASTNDPQVGLQLANAYRRRGQLREAKMLATDLLVTRARADALNTLGMIATDEDRRDDADKLLRQASEAHRGEQRWGKSAEDLQALARIASDVIEQLVILEDAIADARRGRDSRAEAYCRIAAADSLSQVGFRIPAIREIERAEALVTEPSDRIWVDFQRGNVHQNLDEQELAIAAFERARATAAALTNAGGVLSAHINLVYSYAESGRLQEAASQLAAAASLDQGDRRLAVRLSLEARIAARAGDLRHAAALVERAIKQTDPHAAENLLEREMLRGEIAFHRGELADAEASARRALELIEQLRPARPHDDLRSWMITDWRAPYMLLFASQAGRGDARAALVTFTRYHGAAVLAGLVRGDERVASPAADFPAKELARLVSLAEQSVLARSASGEAILAAATAGSLLVFVVACDQLWRIASFAGRLQVSRLGPMSQLRLLLDRLRTAPSDGTVAAALGALLVPPELAGAEGEPLHVVLDEPLSWLPIAALRIGDRALISTRSIVRPARVADVGCAARPQRAAVGEASAAVGAPPVMLNGASTVSEVLDTARNDLIHLQVPVESDVLGDSFVLRDGRVRALEIAGRGKAAARIVLIAPGERTSGTVSLAMALLAAGADQVIATLRPVSASSVAKLGEQLERSADADLAHALARVQRADDPEIGDERFGFAAFGRADCNTQQ